MVTHLTVLWGAMKERESRKGKYTGGMPVLGYDVDRTRLVVNEEEARVVLHIFKRFSQLGSVTELACVSYPCRQSLRSQ